MNTLQPGLQRCSLPQLKRGATRRVAARAVASPDDTSAKFSGGGVCSADEAVSLLLHSGFIALDVRTADEGTYALSSNSATLHVPLVHADWRFDAAAKQRKPVSQQINSRFVEDVKKATNCDMGCKILVFCSDGRSRTMGACRALDAAGFQCLVGLKGGYNAFTRAYDTKLAPRVTDSTGEGRKSPWREVNGTEALSGNQTTMGLNHAGGAGFAMMDAPDNQLPLRDAVAWLEFPLAGNEEEAAAGQPAEVPPSRTPAGHGRVLRDGSVLFSF